jgi:hypothetical protein
MAIVWQNGAGSPKRVGADDWTKVLDFTEIVAQINRRRLLTYRPADAALDDPFDPALWRTAGGVAALRNEFTGSTNLIHPPTGGLGGDPPSPSYMRWLWPEADADEGKPITLASPPPSGEVNFFAKMNGTGAWTDTIGGATWLRAVHLNELRWSCETLRRGRWKMPIYFSAGIIHHILYPELDDTPWVGGVIALSIWGDCRTIGFPCLATTNDPPRGLVDVTVRASSRLWLTCDCNCDVEVGRVTTNPILYLDNPPTWNSAQPGVLPWNTPGGDFASIGTMTLAAGVPQSLTGQAVADALQAMIDGGPPVSSFLVRKLDESFDNASLTGSIDVDFDLGE